MNINLPVCPKFSNILALAMELWPFTREQTKKICEDQRRTITLVYWQQFKNSCFIQYLFEKNCITVYNQNGNFAFLTFCAFPILKYKAYLSFHNFRFLSINLYSTRTSGQARIRGGGAQRARPPLLRQKKKKEGRKGKERKEKEKGKEKERHKETKMS